MEGHGLLPTPWEDLREDNFRPQWFLSHLKGFGVPQSILKIQSLKKLLLLPWRIFFAIQLNSSIFRTIKPFKLLSCFSIHIDSMQIYIAWHSLAGLCSVIKALKVFPYYTIVMVFILDNLLWLWSSHWLAKLGSLSGFNVTFVEKQILMSREKLLKLS